MLYRFGVALLRCVIGLENLYRNRQSNAKLKPIVTWSLAFPAL